MSLLTVTQKNNGAHSYALNGRAVPSVTTCIGELDKPGLRWWYAEQAATWAAENPEMLQRLGTPNFVAMAKRAPNDARDKAGSAGRDLHRSAELLATTGEAPDVPEPQLPMVLQAADFLDSMAVETVASERCVFHLDRAYAGRVDLIATIRGALWLLDFKTGASGVWPEMALQSAGYRFCTHMQGPEPDSDDEPMPPIAHCGIVWVRPEGWQLIPVRADRDIWAAFVSLIPLVAFRKLPKDQLIGAPIASGKADA